MIRKVIMKCPVCLEIFDLKEKRPFDLGCHQVCEECFNKLKKPTCSCGTCSSKDFKCPECRRKFITKNVKPCRILINAMETFNQMSTKRLHEELHSRLLDEMKEIQIEISAERFRKRRILEQVCELKKEQDSIIDQIDDLTGKLYTKKEEIEEEFNFHYYIVKQIDLLKLEKKSLSGQISEIKIDLRRLKTQVKFATFFDKRLDKICDFISYFAVSLPKRVKGVNISKKFQNGLDFFQLLSEEMEQFTRNEVFKNDECVLLSEEDRKDMRIDLGHGRYNVCNCQECLE